jgi:hypothetical protein
MLKHVEHVAITVFYRVKQHLTPTMFGQICARAVSSTPISEFLEANMTAILS